jgi:hypothetical protein
MNLEISDEERLTLLRLVRQELAETRYPTSLEAGRLRALAAKLEGGRKRPRAMTTAHE